MRATVHLDLQHHVGRIDRRIFGGFLEHLGRAVYGGVYDPGSALSDEAGFRRDVIEALRPLGMPVVRYPGGNYVSACDWRDGVGPRAARPRRPDFAWRSVEPNTFGTDEFMRWCAAVGAEPMLAVNLGTATPADAAQYLEYCNLACDTHWAQKRVEHGRAEPYGVKLWCLGNEMDGPWQAGHVPAEVYAQRAQQAAALMKGLDPTIQTVACGSSHPGMPTYLTWDRIVLEQCWPHVDYLACHHYSSNERRDTPWFLAQGVAIDRMLEEYAAVLAMVRGVKKSRRRVYLSFDEWNVWYRARSGEHVDGGWREAPPLLEERYNLEDAIVCAQYLLAFLRRADVVKIACLAQVVNVIAPVMTRADGVLLQTIYHPFRMIAELAHGLSLTPVVASPTYAAGERGDVPTVDAAAAYDPATNGVSLMLVNRSTTEPVHVTVRLADGRLGEAGEAEVLGGLDAKAENTWDSPHTVTPQPLEATGEGDALRVTIPPIGLATLRARAMAR